MVKRYSRSRHNKGKTMKKGRYRRGGGSYVPSAWDFVTNAVGTPDVQAENALVIQPGENIVSRTSNDIEPVSKLNTEFKQSGGRRRKAGRSKKGGSWTATINQALVPFSIWGMQYFTKSRKQPYKSKSRRRRTYRR